MFIKQLLHKAKPKLPDILPSPARPKNVSQNAKWLSGEGAGSWFEIKLDKNSNYFNVTRYSAKGELECDSLFSTDKKFDCEREFQITYPANCKIVNVMQTSKRIVLKVSKLNQYHKV